MWFKVLNGRGQWIVSVYGKDLHEAFQVAQPYGGVLERIIKAS